jgi:hypothetical protein
MKKTAVVFALIVFSMAIILPFSLNIQEANAQTSAYSIPSVEHNVRVLYSGHVVITEKIQLSGSTPSTFEVGLPFKYGSYLLQGIAYDSNNNVLPVALGVQLQDQSGFYGVSVSLTSGTSAFTVVFVLSNAALTSTSTGYTVDFPAYLAFSQSVSSYSGNLTLPSGATIEGIDKPDGVVNATTYTKQNLPAFTYAPATSTISASFGIIQKVNIPTLTRQVNISPAGAITCTDTYKIDNNSTGSITSFLINLPLNATNVVARDQFGRILSTAVQQTNSLVFVYNVTLAVAIGEGTSNLIVMDYSLPSISPAQGSQYILDLDLFPYFNYYVDAASVTVTLPEGATIVSPQLSQIGSSADLTRDAFQEVLTINKQGISFVNSIIPSEDVVSITFDYNPLWIAFRPTSWMWTVAIVGVVVIAVWKRPKAKAKTVTPRVTVAMAPAGVALSSEHLRDFVEAYEEKQKLNSELRALDARAQHGRIPRRRYKVQRRTLELRIESVSHTINNVKAILSRAGGSYADIARQIELADVELKEVELSLQTIEVRHESGELSLENYRKQLSDLERRREKAEDTTNGLLLRLRGEMQ